MIRYIGYACINDSLKPRTFRECRLKSIEDHGIDYLKERILSNLEFTLDILHWNTEHNIFFYRATSTLFPLVTHPKILVDYSWRWYKDEAILAALKAIKEYVISNNIRLTMHPDQFTVLNSPDPKVVHNAIDYLNYHEAVLGYVGGSDMILHTGGIYKDKPSAMKRFVNQYNLLPDSIKSYLRLENDDKSYTLKDVLSLHDSTGVPIIFDLHHHRCHHENDLLDIPMASILKSWEHTNLIPKMHISSGKTNDTDRSHHDYITDSDLDWIDTLTQNTTIDLMIEAKKKELAAIRSITYFKKNHTL